MIRVCFHGAESTGKSTLARQLSERHGWPWVPEYGRAYCEEHGTDLTMEDLLAIAEGQNAAMRAAASSAQEVLLLDTDPLMTAAWAQMLFGEVPARLMQYEKADAYILFAPDTDWIDDGTRFFGSREERARFASVAEDMLSRAGVPFNRVSGDWEARKGQVESIIADLLRQPNRLS